MDRFVWPTLIFIFLHRWKLALIYFKFWLYRNDGHVYLLCFNVYVVCNLLSIIVHVCHFNCMVVGGQMVQLNLNLNLNLARELAMLMRHSSVDPLRRSHRRRYRARVIKAGPTRCTHAIHARLKVLSGDSYCSSRLTGDRPIAKSKVLAADLWCNKSAK